MNRCLKSGFDYCNGEPEKRKVEVEQTVFNYTGGERPHKILVDVCILDPETCGKHVSSTELNALKANSAVGYRLEQKRT
ncbi:hypothetical protein ES702_03791 [subsurface metagenome]